MLYWGAIAVEILVVWFLLGWLIGLWLGPILGERNAELPEALNGTPPVGARSPQANRERER